MSTSQKSVSMSAIIIHVRNRYPCQEIGIHVRNRLSMSEIGIHVRNRYPCQRIGIHVRNRYPCQKSYPCQQSVSMPYISIHAINQYPCHKSISMSEIGIHVRNDAGIKMVPVSDMLSMLKLYRYQNECRKTKAWISQFIVLMSQLVPVSSSLI